MPIYGVFAFQFRPVKKAPAKTFCIFFFKYVFLPLWHNFKKYKGLKRKKNIVFFFFLHSRMRLKHIWIQNAK